MARPPYNKAKEHKVIGTLPAIPGALAGGRFPIKETPMTYRPVSPRENYRMLFRGETPYWIPHVGWNTRDLVQFRPRECPDNVINRQCYDAGPAIDYDSVGNILESWFGITMEWEPVSAGATVRSGNIVLDDINDWQECVPFPDLDSWDWKKIAETNRHYFENDRVNMLGIQFGFWERIMNLMGVENGAVALMDEDQEDAMLDFLDHLSDFYVDYINRICEFAPLDALYLHEDWGTQKAPFFSPDVCRKFFVPQMKKIADCCHSHGMIFEHHCCGCNEILVPCMIESGVDYWFPQGAINNVDMFLDKYQGAGMHFVVENPVLPAGSSEEEIRKIAADFVEKYKDKQILVSNSIHTEEGRHDDSLYPLFIDAVYEYSRKAYSNC